MKYKKILITGGAGFVGSNLSINFKRRYKNGEIIVLDNLKRRGSELNVPRLKKEDITFIHGDIRNKSDFEAIGNVDLIIECSAEPSVLAGLNGHTSYVIDTNLMGLINCLEFARYSKSDIIFLSTSRVYPYRLLNSCNCIESDVRYDFEDNQLCPGVSAKGVSEACPLSGARSLYGATKLASELLIQEYIESFGVKAVINRFGCIAGPWQMGTVDQGVLALWVIKHLYNKKLTYQGFGGQGKQVRDFIHIDDVFDVISKEIDMLDCLNGKTFNVGGGLDNSVSLRQLTALSENISGHKIQISSDPTTRPADLKVYITDNTLVENTLKWKQKRNIEDIIKDTYEWARENKTLLENILS